MARKKITDIAFAALFTALICVLSQISFVTPSVPFTLQTLGVALCGYTLTIKWSAACITTYVAIGTFGLPVFSAFRGGLQILLGPTGGFIFGFIALTIACSLSVRVNKKYITVIISGIGLIICHIIGIFQYSIVTGNNLIFSFLTVSLPFILKDIISLMGAFFISKYLTKHIKGFKY